MTVDETGRQVVVGVQLLRAGARLPSYQTELAAGCDLCACLAEPLSIPSHSWMPVPTGLSMEIPEGYEGQVRPRSGLALKKGLTVLNAPGTIDADYRGEVQVILYNASGEDCLIQPGDRIAQMVIAPVFTAAFVQKEILGQTNRGDGGFGSTGR